MFSIIGAVVALSFDHIMKVASQFVYLSQNNYNAFL